MFMLVSDKCKNLANARINARKHFFMTDYCSKKGDFIGILRIIVSEIPQDEPQTQNPSFFPTSAIFILFTPHYSCKCAIRIERNESH